MGALHVFISVAFDVHLSFIMHLILFMILLSKFESGLYFILGGLDLL